MMRLLCKSEQVIPYCFFALFSLLLSACGEEDSKPSLFPSKRVSRKPKALLALGKDNSYILLENGEVQGWGKIGNVSSATPIKIDLRTTNGKKNTANAITSGSDHRCVILKNGKKDHGHIMCWGDDTHGELGRSRSDTLANDVPGKVNLGLDSDKNPYTAKAVAMGEEHTCAILNNDTVKCWGDSQYGQIGGGTRGAALTASGQPGDPLEGRTATHIIAGAAFTCVILSDSSVECWGWNAFDQTADGTPDLGNNKTAIKIATGMQHACALLNDKTVKCWGDGGEPDTIGTGGVPDLGTGKTATHIAAGVLHTCVILNDNTVKCWGGNDHGQIGGGTASPVFTASGREGGPLGGRAATQIATGSYHTCAILESDNSVECWGRNDKKQTAGGTIRKFP